MQQSDSPSRVKIYGDFFQYERDGVAKIEELENTKLKLQARLAECEGTVENLGQIL
jgi:hypothetical protein